MDPKPWYLSKTIIGAIVTTLASLVQVFGITLPVDLQAEIVSTILLVTTAGGAVLTVVGRITAKTGIGIGKPKPPGGAAMAVLLALALGACAAQEAETPAQTVYALQSDYAAAQVAALGYLESAAPTPTVVAAIRDADAAAMDALTAAQTAVRAGDNPALPALIATARHAVRQLARLVPDTWGPLADF